MSVSVIIPTYNRASVLPRAIDSVLEQSSPPGEIIVVDDGSTDDTKAIIEHNYPQVKYIHQENKGVSTARNVGIEAARYEWIALLDSDDEWLPEKLEKQMEALGKEPDFLICHTDEIWIRNGKRINQMKKHTKRGGHIFPYCLPLCVISPSSVMLHRRIFEEIGPFDPSLPVCEDYDLWLRICARHPVLFLDEPLLVKYGGHEDQLSQAYWGMDRFRIKALQKIIDSGYLDTVNLKAALVMLIRKIEIYVKGAAKRNKLEDVVYYENLKARYEVDHSSLLS